MFHAPLTAQQNWLGTSEVKMKRRFMLSLTIMSGCVASDGDASTGTQGRSSTSATTGDSSVTTELGGTSSSGPATTATSGETEAASSTNEISTSEEGSSTGGPDDPANICAAAATEKDCVGTGLSDLPPSYSAASCKWLEVYTISTGDVCEDGHAPTPRCVLFHGFLTGCGGFGCDEPPYDSEIYRRELPDTVEVFFYPPDICGPEPHAPMDEPGWVGCELGCPASPACTCVCEQLGVPYTLSDGCG